MTPTFAEVSKARYVLLTTFTKDGKPKPFARLSFAWLDERELPEAVKRKEAARPHRRT